MVAGCGHAGYDGCENRVERLIHFSQAVRGVDDCAVNTNRRESHTGSPSDEVTECDDVQSSNERVNQLINADGCGICEQGPRFAERRNGSFACRNIAK